MACGQLETPPGSVVAVEDSEAGLEAARASGMPVLAVGHRRDAGDWSGGVPFVADLRDRRSSWNGSGSEPDAGRRSLG